MHKVLICRGYFLIDKLLTQNNRQHVIINSKEHWSLSTVLTDTEHPMHTHTHTNSQTHTHIHRLLHRHTHSIHFFNILYTQQIIAML